MNLISKDLALSFPFANGQYDHENANADYILGIETYKEWLETLPVIPYNSDSKLLIVGVDVDSIDLKQEECPMRSRSCKCLVANDDCACISNEVCKLLRASYNFGRIDTFGVVK